tara:strand:+ start:534 stop:818 length:285 start_codon:yes stop_codon:yes gene_type:complete
MSVLTEELMGPEDIALVFTPDGLKAYLPEKPASADDIKDHQITGLGLLTLFSRPEYHEKLFDLIDEAAQATNSDVEDEQAYFASSTPPTLRIVK